MFRFILEKTLQKKWMAVSLLCGCTLFIGIAVLGPVYMNGALQKMLIDRLETYGFETGSYPMLTSYEGDVTFYKKDATEQLDKRLQKLTEQLKKLDAPVLTDVTVCVAKARRFQSSEQETDSGIHKMSLACMEDMEAHIRMVAGEGLSETRGVEQPIDVIVSEATFAGQKLTLGSELTFEQIVDESGAPVKFRVAGIFGKKEETDPYWVNSPEDYNAHCFLSPEAYHSILTKALGENEGQALYTLSFWRLYDYKTISGQTAGALLKQCGEAKMKGLEHRFGEVLETYEKDREKVQTTMWILQLPTLFLTLLFIYMVAAKMLAMEQGEIAVLKSRGARRSQIVAVYFWQACMIAGLGAVLGMGIGFLLARLVGLSNSFMQFVRREAFPLQLGGKVWLWLAMSVGISILVMTLPVISKSRMSIVEAKRWETKKKAPLWKRFYLDVVGLLAAAYLCYSFSRQLDSLRMRVRMGEAVDPTLFIASFLFIISSSLLLTRLLPLLIHSIYLLGRKRWSAPCYAAFLHIVRNRDRQDFMMIFLVATVALGVFNAGGARTINANEEINLRYETGADIVIAEKFPTNLAALKYAITNGGVSKEDAGPVIYTEPDGTEYQSLEGSASQVAKVYVRDDVKVSGMKSFRDGEDAEREAPAIKTEQGQVTLLGIQTKEFGLAANMPEHVTKEHWYADLNRMAPDPYGVLVSRNMQKEFSLEVGDCVTYEIYDELNRKLGLAKGQIVGFVDYFPGYLAERYVQAEDGTLVAKPHYLLVASYDMMTSVFGQIPYERWMKNAAGNQYIYDFLAENPRSLTKFRDADNDVVRMKNDPVFQETNGMLTIGFLVSLLLCCTGFLIFQIMGARERELNFGVYRAMGMSRRGLRRMLLLEQLFSTLPALVGGALVGAAATRLYVPLIDVTYMSQAAKTLPAQIILSPADCGQLFVILLFAFAGCFAVTWHLISGMGIAQALKLGEE